LKVFRVSKDRSSGFPTLTLIKPRNTSISLDKDVQDETLLPPFHGIRALSGQDALRGRGYDVVDAPQTPRASHVLHAIREGDEAVLTFFGRKQGTRLEILFIGQASG
jgi:hypothetical protein